MMTEIDGEKRGISEKGNQQNTGRAGARAMVDCSPKEKGEKRIAKRMQAKLYYKSLSQP